MEFTQRVISEPTKWSGENVTIGTVLPDSGREAFIDVYGPRRRYGAVHPPQVNWSGIGSVSVPDAEAYGLLLVRASVVAPTLPGPTKLEDQ